MEVRNAWVLQSNGNRLISASVELFIRNSWHLAKLALDARIKQMLGRFLKKRLCMGLVRTN